MPKPFSRFFLILFILFASIVSSISYSQQASQHTQEFTNEKCSHVLTASGDVLIQRDWYESSRTCFISLHPMDTYNMEYRDYYIDNKGLFLVFNSYGDQGTISETTASRAFVTFPILYDYPDFSIEPDGDVVVKLVSGHLIRMDSKKFSVKKFSPGSFVEKALSKNNKGGLELKPGTGFWLDQGFKMGGMAIENKSGKTTIYGSKEGSCVLKNTELYDYSDENLPLLYDKDQIKTFVQQRCPKLKYN